MSGILAIFLDKKIECYHILIKMFKIFLKDAQVLTAYEQQIWA
jgi:hypothetical protein